MPEQNGRPHDGQSPAGGILQGWSTLHLLCLSVREPSWINLTLQLDRHGCQEPVLRWVSTPTEAAQLLRQQSFDCVIVADVPEAAGPSDAAFPARLSVPEAAPAPAGSPPLDAARFAEVVQSAGCDDPLLVLAPSLTDSRWCQLLALECEVLVSRSQWESPALVPAIARTMEAAGLRRENRELRTMQQRTLQRERDEAEELLRQQQQIVGQLRQMLGSTEGQVTVDESRPESEIRAPGRPAGAAADLAPAVRLPPDVPEGIHRYYHELLRTCVMMGTGSLTSEIAALADVMAAAGLGPRDAFQLHLGQVEQLVSGLGSRSTRHVMTRANLVAIELVLHLGECWQQQALAAGCDPLQVAAAPRSDHPGTAA